MDSGRNIKNVNYDDIKTYVEYEYENYFKTQCEKCKYIGFDREFINRDYKENKKPIHFCPKCESPENILYKHSNMDRQEIIKNALNEYLKMAGNPEEKLNSQGITALNNRIRLDIGILKQNEEALNESKIKYLSVLDILNFQKSEKFLIKDMIYPNTVNCITSPPSGFKSIISMYMAICVSQGKPFFGYETQKGPVLIIDNENNHSIIKSRYEALIKGLKLNKEEIDIRYLLREGKMDDNTFVANVMNYVKENNIKLVIIDTLLRSHSLEENSSKDMNFLYDQFCRLLINDAAVFFLHHTSKDGRYRGSSDILGQVDSMFELEREKDGSSKFRLTNTKNRMGEVAPISGDVFYDKENNVTTIEGITIDPEIDSKPEKEKWLLGQAFIANYAINNPDFKASELYNHLEAASANCEIDISKPYLKKILNWMTKQKILDNTKIRGSYAVNPHEQSKLSKWANKGDDYNDQ